MPDPWGAPGRTGLEVCCIASVEEAAVAVAHVADAVARVRPDGVDMGSGLRSAGRLDENGPVRFGGCLRSFREGRSA